MRLGRVRPFYLFPGEATGEDHRQLCALRAAGVRNSNIFLGRFFLGGTPIGWWAPRGTPQPTGYRLSTALQSPATTPPLPTLRQRFALASPAAGKAPVRARQHFNVARHIVAKVLQIRTPPPKSSTRTSLATSASPHAAPVGSQPRESVKSAIFCHGVANTGRRHDTGEGTTCISPSSLCPPIQHQILRRRL